MNQNLVANVPLEEDKTDSMSPNEPRNLQQGNDRCDSFWLCDSILGFDGRKVKNTDPFLGDECVDRCIPGPLLWLYLGLFEYECGVCFGN